jgi:hypothetical protein
MFKFIDLLNQKLNWNSNIIRNDEKKQVKEGVRII